MDKQLRLDDFRERMISVINAKVTSSRHKYVQLEADTGVPQEKWKKLCNRKQNPTAELIEALCSLWPQYAFWIASGIDDAKNGHISPREDEDTTVTALFREQIKKTLRGAITPERLP